MLSLLVLDCDGVILDSADIKIEAMRRIGEPFGAELRDRLVLFQTIEGGVSRYEKFSWLWQEAHGCEINKQQLHELETKFVGYLQDALDQCPLIPGTIELLKDWHTIMPVYVCSGAPQGELQEQLTRRGLAQYFTKICGYPPEKTTLLQSILHTSGALPEHSLMVGDTQTDARAAEACGTHFYGIGAQFAGAPFPHGPDMHALNTWLHKAMTL